MRKFILGKLIRLYIYIYSTLSEDKKIEALRNIKSKDIGSRLLKQKVKEYNERIN